jgi:hypothetical protein
VRIVFLVIPAYLRAQLPVCRDRRCRAFSETLTMGPLLVVSPSSANSRAGDAATPPISIMSTLPSRFDGQPDIRRH